MPRSGFMLLSGVLWFGLSPAAPARAAFLLEIDTDGANNGAVAFNPNFSFDFTPYAAVLETTVKILFWGVMAPGLWVLSYIRLREQEV